MGTLHIPGFLAGLDTGKYVAYTSFVALVFYLAEKRNDGLKRNPDSNPF